MTPTKIRTDASQLRRQLAEVESEMHPGDYTDILANIAHYLRLEVERISAEIGDNSPAAAVLAEFFLMECYATSDRRPK